MHGLRQFLRLWHISATLTRYRLEEFIAATHLFRPMRWISAVIPVRPEVAGKPRGARLRMALENLGPVYVKFGQIISTRRDLLPADIADELSLLQDQVPPFPGSEAQQIIERALGKTVDELFSAFDPEPLASASIAQVHAVTLNDGREAVAKVVRPGIEKQLRRDIDLLKAIAALAQKYWEGGEKVRPVDIVSEFETFVFDELDMQREAANASLLKRNFKDSPDLYIPEIYWPWCKQDVLVMERVAGLPVGDIEGLKSRGVNLEKLARRGVRVFYTQVFRDNLFHADMHPGNILVDASNPDEPTFIALDFGIVASLTPTDLYYISENFMALFSQDYKRVAQLHIDAGWVPADTRLDELEAAVRTVGEPNFTRPLNEISFGELLFKLFRVAHRFRLTIQPQLIMLQKTLLNVEGLGRQLYPELDLWAVAKPELEAILREKQSVEHAARDLRERLPAWLAQAPDMPGLVHDYLQKATRGELVTRIASKDLEALRREHHKAHRRTLHALAAGAALVSGSLFIVTDSGPWSILGYSAPGLLLVATGVALFALVLRRF
ncbi:MAG: ubiquinone biosynthesis regulatory protein kinase UbiB [Xanthomonadales bacterium]|nr:ubiquinone biosynthesis regulatory protein kinase UbiB [Xanthomonadales bacterium]